MGENDAKLHSMVEPFPMNLILHGFSFQKWKKGVERKELKKGGGDKRKRFKCILKQ
jgi:hypothetical protein